MKKLLLLIIFSIFSASAMTGCEGINPVSPIIQFYLTWKEGEAQKYYPYSSPVVYRAAKRAMIALNYSIDQDEPSSEGHFYIVAGGGDRFKVTIKHIENDIAKLSVRVNFMGDRPYAELLYKKVDEELDSIHFDEQGNPVRRRHFIR